MRSQQQKQFILLASIAFVLVFVLFQTGYVVRNNTDALQPAEHQKPQAYTWKVERICREANATIMVQCSCHDCYNTIRLHSRISLLRPATRDSSSSVWRQWGGARDCHVECVIHALNGDHDTTFTANIYQKFLKKHAIRMIFSRIKNPQRNGKLERLWYEYDRHRWRFSSLQEWINWYNHRLHGALKLEWAETPIEAFQRKLRPESMIGLNLFKWKHEIIIGLYTWFLENLP